LASHDHSHNIAYGLKIKKLAGQETPKESQGAGHGQFEWERTLPGHSQEGSSACWPALVLNPDVLLLDEP
jgi:ABC-type Fe3+/spermidine/putrescine transport system ATPase subunit